jgi:hypothetical protein
MFYCSRKHLCLKFMMLELTNTAQNEVKKGCSEQWFDLMIPMIFSLGSVVRDLVGFKGPFLGLML